MSGIVTNSGLGVAGSSVSQLGQRGVLGNSAFGKDGTRVTVNAATGNLIIQRRDELVVGAGNGINLLRTYNSQGSWDGDNNDNWLLGLVQRVAFATGDINKVNSSNSSVTRTTDDGSTYLYTWNASKSCYTCNESGAEQDSLTWNASTSKWSWTDGASRTVHTYELKGGEYLLTQVADKSDTTTTYIYETSLNSAEGTRLTQVKNTNAIGNTADDETITLNYVAGTKNLESVTTTVWNGVSGAGSAPVISKRVYYSYDDANRLQSVTTDLTPADGVNTDKNTFVTFYTYKDASSKLVTSITQMAGSLYATIANRSNALCFAARLDIEYDSNNRVKRLKETSSSSAVNSSLQNITTFNYDSATKTTIQDAQGQNTVIDYDPTNKRITKITTPDQRTSVFAYDSGAMGGIGRLTTSTDERGNVTTYAYDNLGNLALQRDAAGNTVEYTYDNYNQILTQTSYTIPDPDGAGAGQPGGAQVSRNIYDDHHRLVYSVDPMGRVTKYLRVTNGNGLGQISAQLSYAKDSYVGTQFDQTSLDAWSTSTAAPKAVTQRVDTTYDWRGQVSKVTTYSELNIDGSGNASTAMVVNYSYDQAGQLLQTIDRRGLEGNTSLVSSYSYDGLGRVTVSSNPVGQTTLSQYDDSGNTVTVSLRQNYSSATSLGSSVAAVTVNSYDQAGRLIQVQHKSADSATVLDTTAYTYDSSNHLVKTNFTDLKTSNSVTTLNLYDVAGRLVGTVDGEGYLAEYQYTRTNQLAKTIRYATKVDGTKWANAQGNVLSATLAVLRPGLNPANDQISYTVYDSANRLAKTVNAEGGVVEYSYDGTGQLIKTTARANTIAAVKLGDSSSTANTTLAGKADVNYSSSDGDFIVSDSVNDRISRNFYDKSGQLLASLDALGYLTENKYDQASRLIETVRYNAIGVDSITTNNVTVGNLRATGTLDQVRPAGDVSKDQHTYYLYDAAGRQTGQIDAEGYLSETQYDGSGNVSRTIRYKDKPLALTNGAAGVRIGGVRPRGADRNLGDQITDFVYDPANRRITETAPDATLTIYTYDDAGNLSQVSRASGDAANQRDSRTRYDAMGRVIAQVSAQNAVNLNTALTAAGSNASAIDAAWAAWGTTNRYDARGLKLSSSDELGHKTLYYYDNNGHLTHTVNALGEVAINKYDAFGRVTSTTQVLKPIVAATLSTLQTPSTGAGTAGAINATLTTLSLLSANSDATTTYTFDRANRVLERKDAIGYQTKNNFNAFGQLIGVSRQIQKASLNGLDQWVHSSYTYDKRGQLSGSAVDDYGITVANDGSVTVSATAGKNQTSATQYDAFGRATQTKDGNNVTRSSSYDRLGRQVTLTDGLSNSSTISYDALGRTLTVTDKNGHTSRTVYKDSAREVWQSDALGVWSKSVYSVHGQLLSVTQDANRTAPESTALGLAATAYTGLNRTTTYSYNKDGQLVDTKAPVGADGAMVIIDHNEYDKAGLLSWETDALTHKVAYAYDALNRVLSRTVDPNDTTNGYVGLNLTTKTVYLSEQRQVWSSDANGIWTKTQYDAAGNVTSVTQDPIRTLAESTALGVSNPAAYTTGLNLSTSSTYDAQGKTLTVTDAKGVITKYEYDNLGRRVKETQDYGTNGTPTGATYLNLITQYSYDQNGNLSSKTVDPSGLNHTTWYLYDNEGQLTASVDYLGYVTRNFYDKSGHLTKTTRYADKLSSPPSLSTTEGASLGQVNAIAWPTTNAGNNIETFSQYDAGGRLIYSVDALNYLSQYFYDNAGQIYKTIRYADAISTPQLSAVTDASYNTIDVTPPTANAPKAAQNIVTYTLYDQAGRQVGQVDGEAYLSETIYTSAGQAEKTIRYKTNANFTTSLAATFANAASNRVDISTLRPNTASAANGDQITSYTYDNAGRVQTQTNTDGTVQKNVYDQAGQVIQSIAAYSVADSTNQRITTHEYDAVGRLTRSLDGEGSAALAIKIAASYASDAARAAAIEQVWTDYGTRYQYDPLGQVISQTHGGNTSYLYYDHLGRQVVSVNALGQVSQTGYDKLGRVIWQHLLANAISTTGLTGGVLPSTGALASALNLVSTGDIDTTIVYTDLANGYRSTTTDALGYKTISEYDSLGQLKTQSRQLQKTGSNGNTLGQWVHSSYTYDKRGQLSGSAVDDYGITVANDGSVTVSATAGKNQTSTTQYDAFGRATQTKDGNNVTRSSSYDRLGRQVTLTDGLSNSSTISYDALGRTLTVTDKNGHTSRTVYKDSAREVWQSDALGVWSKSVYSVHGQLLSVTQDANRTAPESTALGLAATAYTGLNRTTTYSYNKDGQLVDTKAPVGADGAMVIIDHNEYDKAGLLSWETDALTHKVAYTYDALNRMLSRTVDPSSDTTTSYVGLNLTTKTVYLSEQRQVWSSDANGIWTKTQYDAAGNVTSVTQDPNRTLAQSTALDISNPAAYTTGLNLSTSSTYDAQGKTLTVTDAKGVITKYEYDNLGRRVKEIQDYGTNGTPTGATYLNLVTQYSYDQNGNLSSKTDALNQVTHYAYDAENRLVFTVDALNQVTKLEYDKNGLVTKTTQFANPLPTPVSWSLADVAAKVQSSAADKVTYFKYDAAGRKVADIDAAGDVTEYVYDALGQLTKTIQYAVPEVNLLSNGNFASGMTGYTTWSNSNTASSGVNQDAAHTIAGQGVLWHKTSSGGTDELSTSTIVAQGAVPTPVPGQRYLVSALVGVTQNTADLYIAYWRNDGTKDWLTPAGGDVNLSNGQASGGAQLSSYKRLWGYVTMPADVKSFQIEVRARRVNPLGEANLYVAAMELKEANPEATDAIYWRPKASAADRVTYYKYDAAGRKVADVDSAGDVTEYIYNALGQVTKTVQYATSAANLLTNGTFTAGTTGFSLVTNVNQADPSHAVEFMSNGYENATLAGQGVLSLKQWGSGGQDALSAILGANDESAITSAPQKTTVVAGETYMVAALVTVHRTVVDLRVRFFSAAGTDLGVVVPSGEGSSTHLSGMDATASYTLEGYKKLWGYVKAPTGAVRAQVEVVKGTGLANVNNIPRSYLFVAGIELRAANPEATDPIYWRPKASAADRTTTFQYDAAGRKLQETAPDGSITRYSYDAQGQLLSTTQAQGTNVEATTTTQYDAVGRVRRTLGGEGTAALSTASDKEAVWAAYGTSYTYNALGQVISSTVAGKRTLYYYDALGRRTYVVDALGQVQRTSYDEWGRVTQTRQILQHLSNLGAYSGGAASVVDGAISALTDDNKDAIVRYSYDSVGRVLQTTDTQNLHSKNEYNALGQLVGTATEIQKNLWTHSSAQYDARGLLTVSTKDDKALDVNGDASVAPSAKPLLNQVTRTIYDAFGQAIETIDPNGVHRYVQYDAVGRQVKLTDGLNTSGTISYDAFSRVLTSTDKLGAKTTYSYNDTTRSMTVTSPEGVVSTTVKTRLGQTSSITDGLNRTTTYSYNKDGQLVDTQAAVGTNGAVQSTGSKHYNAAGQLDWETDALTHKVAYTYDALNRVLSRTVDPNDTTNGYVGLNLTTKTVYLSEQRQVWSSDANGIWTKTQYDAAGNVTSVTQDPIRTLAESTALGVSNPAAYTTGLNLKTSSTYDAQGKTLTVTDAKGVITKYEYDNLGRRVKETQDYGTNGTPTGATYLNLITQYSYDQSGNLSSKTDALGQVTHYAYDAENHLIYAVNALGEVSQSNYDKQGRVVQTTAYATRIAVPAICTLSTVASLVTPDDSKDVKAYTLYNLDGRAAITLSAADNEGKTVYNATQVIYNAAGQAVQTIRYVTQLSALQVANTAVTHNLKDLVADSDYSSALASNPAAWTLEFRWTNINTYTKYDAAGRVRAQIDGTYAATTYRYDAAGNLVATTKYANQVYESLASDPVKWNQGIAGDGSVTTYAKYDAAGRQIASMDATGAVTTYQYNAVGDIVVATQFGTLSSTVSQAGLDAYPATGPSSSTVYKYDAAGRKIASMDATGAVTKYAYDALGRIEKVSLYATLGSTISAVGLDSFLGTTAKTATPLNETTYGYDAAGRRTIVTDRYGYSIKTQYDAVGNAVAVTDQNGNIGYFYFDALGRNTLQVSPSGYVTQFWYDALGNRIRVTQYANRQSNVANVTTLPTVAPESSADSTVSYTYDQAGRVLTSFVATGYDAEKQVNIGVTKTTTYDAFGNIASATNGLKDGVTTYTYDANGRMTQEVLPIKTTNNFGTESNVVNHYSYDSFGNKTGQTLAYGAPEALSASYTYDKLGRLLSQKQSTSVTTTTVEVTGSVSGKQGVTPEITQVYDAAGNVIQSKDANGNSSYFYYDALNRKIASVDAGGTLSRFAYDAAGNLINEKVYGDPVVLPSNPGGNVPTPVNVANLRETEYEYDADNRQIRASVVHIAVLMNLLGGAHTPYTDASSSTLNQYDHAGNLIKQTTGYWHGSDGNYGGETSYFYYDAAGRKIVQIDAAGYATTWTYADDKGRQSAGKPVKQVQYATALTSLNLSQLTLTAAPLPYVEVSAALKTIDAKDSKKRVTEYTYDLKGRLIIQKLKNVEMGTVSGGEAGAPSVTVGLNSFAQTSTLTKKETQVTENTIDVETTYQYDGLDNIIVQTDGEVKRSDFEYDLAGRQTKQKGAEFVDYLGNKVRQETDTAYDGLGNVLKSTEVGAGALSSRSTSYTYVGGRKMTMTDAAGRVTTYTYDANGNQTQSIITLDDADANKATVATQQRYDSLNRIVWQSTYTTVASGTWQAPVGQGTVTEVRYDAYGQVTGRRINASAGMLDWQEWTLYNKLGKAFLTNSSGGAQTAYFYDANGNKTMSLQSPSKDMRGISEADLATVWNTYKADYSATLFQYDQRNQLTCTTQSAMTDPGIADVGVAQLVTQAFVPPTQTQGYYSGGQVGVQSTMEASPFAADGVNNGVTGSVAIEKNSSVAFSLKYQEFMLGDASEWVQWQTVTVNTPSTSLYGAGDYELWVTIKSTLSGGPATQTVHTTAAVDAGKIVFDLTKVIKMIKVAQWELGAVIQPYDFPIYVELRQKMPGAGTKLIASTTCQRATVDPVSLYYMALANPRAASGTAANPRTATGAMTGSIPKGTITIINQPVGTKRVYLYRRALGSQGPYNLLELNKVTNSSGFVVEGMFQLGADAIADGQYDCMYVAVDVAGNVLNRQYVTLDNRLTKLTMVQTTPATVMGGSGLAFFSDKTVLNFLELAKGASATSNDSYQVRYRVSGTNNWSAYTTVAQSSVLVSADPVRGWMKLDLAATLKLDTGNNYDIEVDDYVDAGYKGTYQTSVYLNGASSQIVQAASSYRRKDAIVTFTEYSHPDAAKLFLTVQGITYQVNFAGGKAIWNASTSAPTLVPSAPGSNTYAYSYVVKNASDEVVDAGHGDLTLGKDGKATLVEDSRTVTVTNATTIEFTVDQNPLNPSAVPVAYISLSYANTSGAGSGTVDLVCKNGKAIWDVTQLSAGTYNFSYNRYDSTGELMLNAQNKFEPVRGTVTLGPATSTSNSSSLGWQILATSSVGNATVTRSQKYDAFGDIVEQIDGNGYVTKLFYNAMGRLIEKDDPEVTDYNAFVGDNNAANMDVETPKTYYYYDRSGAIVAVKDANGHVNSSKVLAGSSGDAPQVTMQYNADGGWTQYGYDVFGQLRSKTVAVSLCKDTSTTYQTETTDYEYDERGLLTKQSNPIRSDKTQATLTFVYDALGRRVQSIDALGSVSKTFYDAQGRIVKTTDAENFATTYEYHYDNTIVGAAGSINGQGGWVLTTTSADGKTLIDKTDYFGQKIWHQDQGGHTFNYHYNWASWLDSQSGSSGQDISYAYYMNGYLKEVIDAGMNVRTKYGYDKNGNRTYEGYMSNTKADGEPGKFSEYYQDSKVSYDALNRVTEIYDSKADITYKYDAVGNRRQVRSYYHNGINGAQQLQDYWYAYDAMNRFVVTKGKENHYWNGNGSVVRGNTDGVELTYNLAGERIAATMNDIKSYSAEGVAIYDTAHTEEYSYTNDGYLKTSKGTKVGNDGKAITIFTDDRTVDLAGRTTEETITNVATGGSTPITTINTTYDKNGNTLKRETSKKAVKDVISVGDSLNVEEFDYGNKLGFGHVGSKSLQGLQTQTSKGSWSWAYGKVAWVGESTTKLVYTYEYWDSAKQTKITKDNENGKGISILKYDANGHIMSSIDVKSDRTTTFTTNHDGQVLRRNQVMPNQADIQTLYYYLNGNTVGEVSNDGSSQVSFAESLALAEQNKTANAGSWRYGHIASSADFDQNYQPITPSYPASTPGKYVAQAGDTLAGVARSVFGDASLWYLIADANGLSATAALVPGQVLVIPNMVANIHNTASTIRPYNAAQALGDLNPTTPAAPTPLPPPPPPRHHKHCGVVGILIAVVVAVVAWYVAPALVGAVAGEMGATVAAGTGAISGGVLGSATGAVATAVGYGVTAAAASAVTQGLQIAVGARSSFSFADVGVSALSAGLAAGFAEGIGSLKSWMTEGMSPFARGLTTVGIKATAGAVGNVASQGMGLAMGMQTKFDWAGVASAAAGSAVGEAISQMGFLKDAGKQGSNFKWGMAFADSGRSMAREAISNASSQGMASLLDSSKNFNWTQLASKAGQAGFSHFLTEENQLFKPSEGAGVGEKLGMTMLAGLGKAALGQGAAALGGGRFSWGTVATDTAGSLVDFALSQVPFMRAEKSGGIVMNGGAYLGDSNATSGMTVRGELLLAGKINEGESHDLLNPANLLRKLVGAGIKGAITQEIGVALGAKPSFDIDAWGKGVGDAFKGYVSGGITDAVGRAIAEPKIPSAPKSSALHLMSRLGENLSADEVAANIATFYPRGTGGAELPNGPSPGLATWVDPLSGIESDLGVADELTDQGQGAMMQWSGANFSRIAGGVQPIPSNADQVASAASKGRLKLSAPTEGPRVTTLSEIVVEGNPGSGIGGWHESVESSSYFSNGWDALLDGRWSDAWSSFRQGIGSIYDSVADVYDGGGVDGVLGAALGASDAALALGYRVANDAIASDSFAQVTGGVLLKTGVMTAEAFRDAGLGAATGVLHPLDTAASIYDTVSNPSQTWAKLSNWYAGADWSQRFQGLATMGFGLAIPLVPGAKFARSIAEKAAPYVLDAGFGRGAALGYAMERELRTTGSSIQGTLKFTDNPLGQVVWPYREMPQQALRFQLSTLDRTGNFDRFTDLSGVAKYATQSVPAGPFGVGIASGLLFNAQATMVSGHWPNLVAVTGSSIAGGAIAKYAPLLTPKLTSWVQKTTGFELTAPYGLYATRAGMWASYLSAAQLTLKGSINPFFTSLASFGGGGLGALGPTHAAPAIAAAKARGAGYFGTARAVVNAVGPDVLRLAVSAGLTLRPELLSQSIGALGIAAWSAAHLPQTGAAYRIARPLGVLDDWVRNGVGGLFEYRPGTLFSGVPFSERAAKSSTLQDRVRLAASGVARTLGDKTAAVAMAEVRDAMLNLESNAFLNFNGPELMSGLGRKLQAYKFLNFPGVSKFDPASLGFESSAAEFGIITDPSAFIRHLDQNVFARDGGLTADTARDIYEMLYQQRIFTRDQGIPGTHAEIRAVNSVRLMYGEAMGDLRMGPSDGMAAAVYQARGKFPDTPVPMMMCRNCASIVPWYVTAITGRFEPLPYLVDLENRPPLMSNGAAKLNNNVVMANRYTAAWWASNQ